MNYRPFGRTGIKVSSYCLGAMMFGAIGNPDREECNRIIHKALDAGINFIDTADAYNKGESEEIVGNALKGRRDNVVIGTKVYHPTGSGPNQQGGSRRWITRAAENSLRRLQPDYIDLYQLHRPRAGHRYRRDSGGVHRSGACGEDPHVRNVYLPPPPTSWMHSGRRAAWAHSCPRRATALLHPEPRDRIDEIVPPAVDIAPLEGAAYVPPAIKEVTLRRRPVSERSAA